VTRPGGDAIYEALLALGVDKVFGVVSVHNVPIFDAVARRGEIEIVTVRHEQAAAHAADGYARVTGRLGVAIASTGPGTTNTMTGLYEAAFASSPVLLITGQVQTSKYGRSQAMLHEAERQLEMLRSVCRHVESPRRPDDVVASIYRTAADVLSGRPMPGAVEIPIDLQHGEVPSEDLEPLGSRPVAVDTRALDAAADLLRASSRRLLWAGGGVVRAGASEALVRLAEETRTPVLTTTNGRGAMPEDHELSIGPFSTDQNVRAVIADAEVVCAIGTRFRWTDTGNYSLRFAGKLVHIDADPDVFGRTYEPDVRVLGDARDAILELAAALHGVPGDEGFVTSAQQASQAARDGMRAAIGGDHASIMDAMRSRLPRRAVIVRDSTVPAYMWADRLLPVYEPGTAVSPTSAAIGPGLPLAIGAAAATGEPTLAIHGDGGFMLHAGELATAAQFDLPLKVCVFNDGGYGVLRGIQRQRYEGREIGVDLLTPDFVRLASSVHVPAEHVRSAAEFDAALARALDTRGPYLLDVDMDALAPMTGLGARRRQSANDPVTISPARS
jgi:acetolactate synthase-1/2/3 large subunit